ncbi:MAG: hypothetical protein V7646_1951 [Pseudonocardia sp.]
MWRLNLGVDLRDRDRGVEDGGCPRRSNWRWGARRLVHELVRHGVAAVPSRVAVHRVVARHGLVEQRPQRRKCSDYRRRERDAPMALWQLGIVDAVMIDIGSASLAEAKVGDRGR